VAGERPPERCAAGAIGQRPEAVRSKKDAAPAVGEPDRSIHRRLDAAPEDHARRDRHRQQAAEHVDVAPVDRGPSRGAGPHQPGDGERLLEPGDTTAGVHSRECRVVRRLAADPGAHGEPPFGEQRQGAELLRRPHRGAPAEQVDGRAEPELLRRAREHPRSANGSNAPSHRPVASACSRPSSESRS
jgi:hypothetical protein